MSLDGVAVDEEAVKIATNFFSVLLNEKSREIRVTPTPTGALILQTDGNEFTAEVIDARAWRGRRHTALEAKGRQQIVAPMPGKIVRVLVQTGEKVQAAFGFERSEEHTSELQSRQYLVCRLLLEQKKNR